MICDHLPLIQTASAMSGCRLPPRCLLDIEQREFDQRATYGLMSHSEPNNQEFQFRAVDKYSKNENRTCSTLTVSTAFTPPILSINSPHLSTTPAISLFCTTVSPSTTGIFSTIAATTASLTRFRGTFDAILSVLSSTAALSTEWPSANAR